MGSLEQGSSGQKPQAFILCGGRSSRMGRDKSRLPFGGFDAVLEFQYRRLVGYDLFSRVSISQKTAVLPFDAPVVLDQSELYAPIAAIAGILRTMDCERAFFLAVDTPFFAKREIETLLNIEAQAAIARTPSGIHPLCAVYHASLAAELETVISQGKFSIKHALRNAAAGYADFDEDTLLNFNTPAEYDRALKVADAL